MAVKTDRANGGDEDLMHRYREASAELDERPAASVRASILAAAAREVGATPIDAKAAYRRSRPRWPLAAAAAVMLSTLAVMLAIRTQDEMPQFSTPAEPARGVAEKVAPAAEKVAPTPMATEQAPREQQAIDQLAKENRQAPEQKEKAIDRVAKEERQATAPSKPEAPRARREADGLADAPSEAKKRVAAAAADASAPVNVPAAEPAPPPPKSLGKLSAQESESRAAAPVRQLDQAGADMRRDAPRAAAPAPSTATSSERNEADESAAAWLERIVRLRREGKHAEADAELKRFRERYPQVQPPLEALPATGTR